MLLACRLKFQRHDLKRFVEHRRAAARDDLDFVGEADRVAFVDFLGLVELVVGDVVSVFEQRLRIALELNDFELGVAQSFEAGREESRAARVGTFDTKIDPEEQREVVSSKLRRLIQKGLGRMHQSPWAPEDARGACVGNQPGNELCERRALGDFLAAFVNQRNEQMGLMVAERIGGSRPKPSGRARAFELRPGNRIRHERDRGRVFANGTGNEVVGRAGDRHRRRVGIVFGHVSGDGLELRQLGLFEHDKRQPA